MFGSLSVKLRSLPFLKTWPRHVSLYLTILLAIFLFSSWMENVILSVGGIPSYNAIFDVTFTVLRYACYILMAAGALLNLFLLKKAYNPLLFLIIGVLSVLVFLFSRSTTFAILTLYLFAFAPLGFKRGLKTYLLMQGGVLFLVLLLACFGLFPDLIMDAARNRHGLGFTWVTTAPVLFLFFLFGLLLLFRSKISFVSLFALSLCSMGFFLSTDTRFAFLLSIILLLIYALWKYNSAWFSFVRSRWFMYALIALPILLSVIAFVLMITYSKDNTLMVKLNGMLSGRLANSKAAYDQYGLSIFGAPIVWHGNTPTETGAANYLYVDCSYLNILLNYGVLYFLLVLGWCTRMVHVAWKKNDELMLIVLAFLFFFAFFEVRLINPLYNPFLLYGASDLRLPMPHAWTKWFDDLVARMDSRSRRSKKERHHHDGEEEKRLIDPAESLAFVPAMQTAARASEEAFDLDNSDKPEPEETATVSSPERRVAPGRTKPENDLNNTEKPDDDNAEDVKSEETESSEINEKTDQTVEEGERHD